MRRLINLFLLFFTSCFITISLLTYRSADTSLIFDSSKNLPIKNLMGKFGANFAALLLYFLGFSALLLIPLIWSYFLSKVSFLNFKFTKDRIIAYFLLIITTSALLNVNNIELFDKIYPGGYLGFGLKKIIFYFFQNQYIVQAFLILLSISFFIIIDRFFLLKYILKLFSYVKYIPVNKLFLFFLNIKNYIFVSLESLIEKVKQKIGNKKDNKEIFEDPFWNLYMQPAHKDQESSSLNNKSKKFDKDFSQDEIITHQEEDHFENKDYVLPGPLIASEKGEKENDNNNLSESKKLAQVLEDKLEKFSIKGKVVSITNGPVVTLFEYQPDVDTKISNIIARENDLALALQAISLRIIAPIPGKSVVGFEVAHNRRKSVLFSNLLSKNEWINFEGQLPLIFGKDTLSNNIIIDLVSMPHLLVAGSTGSGKSVCLNVIIMSLLCNKNPEDLKLILIDPKRLEFASYCDISHLLFPVVTDPTRAILVLKWAVKTMEERYAIMAQSGVRNINEYRASGKKDMPFIVIVIDELADLMMTAGKDVENLIARLAQMARAAGMHLIIATQRPSVDVITGLIKVNFPSRIAFKVTSKVDSRTIIDVMGAEKLLGKGDMLFLDSKGSINRVHGAYVTDKEIEIVVNAIKKQRTVDYQELNISSGKESSDERDELFEQIVDYISKKDEVSISLIQRVFKIGYNRSARIMDQLESDGYIMPADGSKMRKIIKNT